MSGDVSFHMKENVAWLGLSEAGPHVLSADFSVKIGEAFELALQQPDAVCIVLSGLPKGFPRGYANSDMPDVRGLEATRNVLKKIEDCPLPVVALIPDAALNEGLELALSAHYRISSTSPSRRNSSSPSSVVAEPSPA